MGTDFASHVTQSWECLHVHSNAAVNAFVAATLVAATLGQPALGGRGTLSVVLFFAPCEPQLPWSCLRAPSAQASSARVCLGATEDCGRGDCEAAAESHHT
jgi:hypothetical protein